MIKNDKSWLESVFKRVRLSRNLEIELQKLSQEYKLLEMQLADSKTNDLNKTKVKKEAIDELHKGNLRTAQELYDRIKPPSNLRIIVK